MKVEEMFKLHRTQGHPTSSYLKKKPHKVDFSIESFDETFASLSGF